MMLLPAYGRVTFDGFTVTRRTRAMLNAIEKRTGLKLLLAQGSYNPGGVAASGSSHDREAVDARLKTIDHGGHIRALTTDEIQSVMRAAKDVGFAAFHRVYNWDGHNGGAHIHMLPIGGDLSPSAQLQVRDFDNWRDGLRSEHPDHSYRPSPKVRWSYRLGKPVPR